MELHIANVVANSFVDDTLNLNIIKKSLENCEYEPEQYFALIYRLNYPKLSILVNRSGKIIFTGAKSVKDIEAAQGIFLKDLKMLGYHPKLMPITIQNLVVVARYDYRLDLGVIFKINCNKNIIYNPKDFHGLVFRNINPKFTALIFKSGNVLISGLKRFADVKRTLNIVEGLLTADCHASSVKDQHI